MSVKSYNITEVTGPKTIEIEKQYIINENTIIELKGEFRSSGKIKSKIQFGLKCLREDGRNISGTEIYRYEEPITIESINSDNKTIILEQNPKKWNNQDHPYANLHCKYIGIYLDGDIKHLPDYLLKYSNYDNNILYLNEPVTDDIFEKIKINITKVMNHADTNNYDYSAAGFNGDNGGAEEVPSENWKEYKAIYKGFGPFTGVIKDIRGKFRPGTKQVQPIILCNYGQNNDAILEIKNIEMILKNTQHS